MKKIKVCFVGCGRISTKHLNAILSNKNYYELVAVCDLNQPKAEKISKLYFLATNKYPKIYRNYKKMLKCESVDLVSILTPSGLHFEHAIFAINMKKDVLIEKPIAMNSKDILNIIKQAKINNVSVGVCFQKRFNRDVLELKNAIKNDKLGKIYSIYCSTYWNRSDDYYKLDSWRGTKKYDGGVLMNQSIHLLDILLWLVDSEIEYFNSYIHNYNHPINEVEDYASLNIKFINGVYANLECTVNTFGGNYAENIIIVAEKAFIHIGGKSLNELVECRGLSIKKDKSNNSCDIYGDGHSNVYSDYATNSKFIIDANEGLKAVQLIEKVYKR